MAAPAELTVMSMYSDLLAASIDNSAPRDEVPAGELLVRLVESRRRLEEGVNPMDPPKSAEDLALHLDYDRALLTFCRARGIDTDPSRFSDLHRERHRLEEELVRVGLDVASLHTDLHEAT